MSVAHTGETFQPRLRMRKYVSRPSGYPPVAPLISINRMYSYELEDVGIPVSQPPSSAVIQPIPGVCPGWVITPVMCDAAVE